MAKNSFNLNIDIEEEGWNKALSSLQELSDDVLDRTLTYVKEHKKIDFLQTNNPLNINLCLSNDENIHALNAKFRHMDKPTNVLSFANIDDEFFYEEIARSNVIELGDIMIALETMQREAAEKQISLHDHYCHLFIHGILHLLGFDHMEDDEAEEMESYEIAILASMHIANPY